MVRRARREVDPELSALLLMGALFAAGCVPVGLEEPVDGTGGASQGSGGSGSDLEPPEPGTCNAWKVSYCKAVARCSFDSRAKCETDVGYVMCLEDAPFGACAKALDEAKCDEMPDHCGPQTIADRTLPTSVCRDMQREICEWSLYCGYEFSLEGCQATLAQAQPCGEFTAVLPGYEQCLLDWRTLPCDVQMPPSCEGILRR